MYLMNIPQEEENELDALQSAKELEEEKKKEKERQAKMVREDFKFKNRKKQTCLCT